MNHFTTKEHTLTVWKLGIPYGTKMMLKWGYLTLSTKVIIYIVIYIGDTLDYITV